MRNRLVFALLVAALAGGCTTHASAALAVDTPLVPYLAPDIDELMGDDLFDDAEELAPTAEPTAEPAADPATTPAKAGQ
ncbi:MAG: hypothetical protein R3B48_10605 [Kofleriaceae bacterium]